MGQFKGLEVTGKLKVAQALEKSLAESNPDEDSVQVPVPKGQFKGLELTGKLKVAQRLEKPLVEPFPVPDEDLAQAPVPDPIPENLPKQTPSGTFSLKLMVTRARSWIVVGLLLLLAGVLWGISSPTIPYIGIPNELDYSYGTTSKGDVYIYSTNHSMFFVARRKDFSHPIDLTKSNQDILVYVLARPDKISVNDTIDGKLHVTQAHVIERLEVQDMKKHSLGTYTARDYNPSGIYENRWWPVAAALIAAGLLITCVACFAGLKRRKAASLAPSA
jgi:hypothetical protein